MREKNENCYENIIVKDTDRKGLKIEKKTRNRRLKMEECSRVGNFFSSHFFVLL